jgi:hypothetical protein
MAIPAPATSRFSHLDTAALRAALEPLAVPVSRVTNWARAFSATPRKVYEPSTCEECAQILELASREGVPVRVIGVVHSPSDLALTTGYMLRTLRLNRVLDVRRSCLAFASREPICPPVTLPYVPRSCRPSINSPRL